VGAGGEERGKRGLQAAVGQSVGQSAAELAEAILAVIERGGKHVWVEVVELCARAKRGASLEICSHQRLRPTAPPQPYRTALDLDRAGAASQDERAAG
jgi:hypothetical protein